MNKAQPFTAQFRRIGEIVAIDLHGEVDSFADSELSAVYAEVESHNPAVVVLNFSDVNYINSTGIALIVSMLAKARKSGRKIVVFGLTDHYITIFQITRLADFMEIYPDEAAALAGVAPGNS